MRKLIVLAMLAFSILMNTQPSIAHGYAVADVEFERDGALINGAYIRGHILGTVSETHKKVWVEVWLSIHRASGEWDVIGRDERICRDTNRCSNRTAWNVYDCHRDYAVAGGVRVTDGEGWHAFDGSGTSFKWATC